MRCGCAVLRDAGYAKAVARARPARHFRDNWTLGWRGSFPARRPKPCRPTGYPVLRARQLLRSHWPLLVACGGGGGSSSGSSSGNAPAGARDHQRHGDEGARGRRDGDRLCDHRGLAWFEDRERDDRCPGPLHPGDGDSCRVGHAADGRWHLHRRGHQRHDADGPGRRHDGRDARDDRGRDAQWCRRSRRSLRWRRPWRST